MALAGRVSRAMMERSSHTRMEAKRKSVEDLRTDFEPGLTQNCAQFFVSERLDGANSWKRFGEPGRTRICNPLVSPRYVAAMILKGFPVSYLLLFVYFGRVLFSGMEVPLSGLTVAEARPGEYRDSKWARVQA